MRYTIQKDETIWSIFIKRYNKFLAWEQFKDELAARNPGISVDKVREGQVIDLPDIESTAFKPSSAVWLIAGAVITGFWFWRWIR